MSLSLVPPPTPLELGSIEAGEQEKRGRLEPEWKCSKNDTKREQIFYFLQASRLFLGLLIGKI